MARANIHHLPGYVWHITHRCHKKEFLLKFGRDRARWLFWLFEAKKRYGLTILNYTVTSNHIHLLLLDTQKDVIPKSLQLVAGRLGQEYNKRKKRRGAYWEDRYHATAIDTSSHFFKCMAYIDLNMVRAGVVKHPSNWKHSGCNEFIRSPERYSIISQKALLEIVGLKDWACFQKSYSDFLEDILLKFQRKREGIWTESVAVGNEEYSMQVAEKLGIRIKGRKVLNVNSSSSWVVKESEVNYGYRSEKHKDISLFENTYYWDPHFS